MARGALAWHLVKPLFGLNLPDSVHESLLSPRNLRRIARTRELAVVAGIQAIIFVLVSAGGRHPFLAILPFTSAATFGLFFSQLRGIAEHGATTQAGSVRSHAPNWPDRILLHDVNFNFHREHHLYPQCPSCHLPAIHLATMGSAELSASMFGTVRAIYRASRPAHG
jgi:fatty acid desaturase